MEATTASRDPVQDVSELVQAYGETPPEKRPVVLAWIQGFLAGNNNRVTGTAAT